MFACQVLDGVIFRIEHRRRDLPHTQAPNLNPFGAHTELCSDCVATFTLTAIGRQIFHSGVQSTRERYMPARDSFKIIKNGSNIRACYGVLSHRKTHILYYQAIQGMTSSRDSEYFGYLMGTPHLQWEVTRRNYITESIRFFLS